jgi:hypothetical protein
LPVLIVNKAEGHVYVDDVPVFAPVPHPALPAPCFQERLLARTFWNWIQRCQQLCPVSAHDLGGTIAVQRLGATAPVNDAPRQVGGDHGFAHAVQQLRLEAQALLATLLCRHVAYEQEVAAGQEASNGRIFCIP